MSAQEEDFASFYQSTERARHYRDKFHQSRRRSDSRERKLVGELLDRAGIRDGLILDVPSGAGRFHEVLRSRGCRVIAGDVSPSMLRLSRTKPILGGVALSAPALPFESGRFDGVLSIRFLHHFSRAEDRISVLRSLARVTRGFAIVSFFSSRSLQAVRRTWRVRSGRHLTRRYAQSPSSFIREAGEAGFRVKSLRYSARWISEWTVALLLRSVLLE